MYPFTIGIPTYNRKDLLIPALMYYQIDFPGVKIMILDNGNQHIVIPGLAEQNNVFMCRSKENLGVAASWNHLIEKSFEDPKIQFAAILNDDVYWGIDRDTLHVIVSLMMPAALPQDAIMLPQDSKYDWSVFVISRNAWNKVGRFDEKFFPAYFEDKDYEYRAKLAGVPITYNLPGPVRFIPSGTIQKDISLLSSSANLAYYVSKWGGVPGQEKYTIPFNLPPFNMV